MLVFSESRNFVARQRYMAISVCVSEVEHYSCLTNDGLGSRNSVWCWQIPCCVSKAYEEPLEIGLGYYSLAW
jgi:hypothetical protein